MSSALQHQSVNLPRRHDPHNPKSTAGKAFLHAYRPVYQVFGFKKGYNFPLYLVTVGALMGFILARLQFLNIEGTLFEVSHIGHFLQYTANDPLESNSGRSFLVSDRPQTSWHHHSSHRRPSWGIPGMPSVHTNHPPQSYLASSHLRISSYRIVPSRQCWRFHDFGSLGRW